MKDLEQMLELLEQKRLYFLHYEKEMEALPLLPAEELDPCVQRGAILIKKIEELDGRLKQLAQQNGSLARSALYHDCDRGQLSADLGKLYDASMAVKAVASRILQNDATVRERIAYERDKALNSLREMSQHSSSVASKYRRSAQTGLSGALAEPKGKEV
ncbi:MAG: hypothetical protein FWH49_04165 [Clostridiales bacterium]|nr:hypothetical protein [Clostridiales bacterium]